MSLEATEAASAAVATAPRVRLEDIEAAIAYRLDLIGSAMLDGDEAVPHVAYKALSKYSLCILVLRNGYVVAGFSAPASDENYDRELGKKFAYENAVRQIWPLMGFALREKLNEPKDS